MGLTQGAGIFSAIKIYCSLLPCGSLAQKFPAPAHVLSLCLFVYVGDRPPGAYVSSTAGSGSSVPGSPSSWFGFGCLLPPKEFPPVVAVAVSEQCLSKFKALKDEL